MKFSKWIIPFLVLLSLIIIFRGWISTGVLSAGDWPYLFPKAVAEIVPLSSWDSIFSSGVGQSALLKLWNDSYALSILKLANVLSWPIFERIVWFFPYIVLSFFASFFLSKKILKNTSFSLLAGLIYTANTYSLLIVSGGQVGVMMAYAFLPIAFLTLLNLFEELSLKKSLIFSLVLSFLVLLDLRVGYMFIAAQMLFILIYLIYNHSKIIAKIFYTLIIPGIVAFLVNAFWILPNILVGKNPSSVFSDIYTSAASLDFFSFAKLEDAISLFHPNWPDNFFGKTSFLPPEVLIVAILAFSALLFVNLKDKKQEIVLLSLSLLSLIAILLAKGTNEPFGEIYRFLFNTIPGFVMFRDPTKWYMLIAISYSMMIPFALLGLSESGKNKIKNFDLKIIVPVIFIVLWAIIIRDAFTGNVRGTLFAKEVPLNYQKLANVLSSDKNFSRTLWVPTYDTFSYNSITHPEINATEFLAATSSADLIRILKLPRELQTLQNLSVTYVAVPQDTSGRIFVTDRKYDEKVYKKTVNDLGKINYLKPFGSFGKIKVFEVGNPKGHFWGVGDKISVSSKYISPTKYLVNIKNAKEGDVLIFNDSYDRLWRAGGLESMPFKISKQITFNSFVLKKGGIYELTVYYIPQKWVEEGLVISLISLVVIIALIFKLKRY